MLKPVQPKDLVKWREELYRDSVDHLQKPSEIIKLSKMIKYSSRQIMTTRFGVDGLRTAKKEIINSMIKN